MSKHTPGPWYVGRQGNLCRIYAEGEPHAIARTYGPGLNGIGVCELTGPRSVADARLIAAAPELLEVVIAFMDAIHLAPDMESIRAGVRAADLKARVAVAKVLGDAP